MRLKKQALAMGAILAMGVSLAACGDNDSAQDTKDTATSTVTESAKESAKETAAKSSAKLAFEDSYCKAKADEDTMGDDAMGDMTGCFGTLVNNSDKEIVVKGFTVAELAKDDDADFELHETVNGTMQKKEGGFKIPAGGKLELAPGGNHLMIMDYEDEIPAGDDLTFTFETEGGDTAEATVPVREVAAGNESYHGGDSDEHGKMDHGKMDHEKMDHSEHANH